MNKVSAYVRDSYHELLEKVTWPTWPQLQQSTVVVLIATLIIMGCIWAMDTASAFVLKFIYSFFK
ncbi:MAG TPA: preprotein translocase subunit SecE [Chitinophagaceae bacterium]|nr:preprotein translocase subunit SecE [Chitinophagaceae bacterium]